MSNVPRKTQLSRRTAILLDILTRLERMNGALTDLSVECAAQHAKPASTTKPAGGAR